MEPNTESSGSSRRTFHLAVIYGFGAIISALVAIPTALYLLIPPKARKDANYIDAGDISQLTPGTPVEMSFQETRFDGWRLITEKKTAWVVKEADNKILAFGPQCTHLGCAYHWESDKNKFFCPCHNSVFSIDGKVLVGPRPGRWISTRREFKTTGCRSAS